MHEMAYPKLGVIDKSRLGLIHHSSRRVRTMSGFDADRIWNVSVHNVPDPTAPEAASETSKLLYDFLLQYRVGGEFIYRCVWFLLDPPPGSHEPCYTSDKLRANLLLKQYFLEVDLRHVGLYNDELAHAIQDRPTEVLPLVSGS